MPSTHVCSEATCDQPYAALVSYYGGQWGNFDILLCETHLLRLENDEPATVSTEGVVLFGRPLVDVQIKRLGAG